MGRYLLSPQKTSQTTAVLCPNCRRLVSTDEHRCPYCGVVAPGARWKHSFFAKGLTDTRRFVEILIMVNGIMYLVSLLLSHSGPHVSLNPLYFLSPDSQSLILLGGTGTIPIDRLHRWWSLLSASYLHGGIFHIIFNMLALRQIAPLIIQEYGTYRMFIIYTLGGVGGSLVSYLAGVQLTIGASAAICGLIGAALYYGRHRGGTYGQTIYRQVGGWALGLVVFGLLVPGINNWGHGGGIAAGILLGMMLGYQERKVETFAQRQIAIVLMLGTALVLVWAGVTALLYQL